MKDHRMNDLEDGDQRQILVSASGESRDALNRFAVEREVLVVVNQDRLDEAWVACEIATSAVKFDPGSHYFSPSILQELNRIGEAMTACNSTGFPTLPPTPIIFHVSWIHRAQSAGMYLIHFIRISFWRMNHGYAT